MEPKDDSCSPFKIDTDELSFLPNESQEIVIQFAGKKCKTLGKITVTKSSIF